LDKLIADTQVQLERLLDLYLAGEFPKDLLNERKARFEGEIKGHNKERAELLQVIGQRALTEEEIQDILTFAAAIREELLDVDQEADIHTKHRIFELLRLKVTLEVKEGKNLYHASCYLGDMPCNDEDNHQCESSGI